MAKPGSFTKRDIERAVAGALKGGWEPGAFMVEITPSGSLRIFPVNAVHGPRDALDDELAEWRARNAEG
jgi:hypothetical protein